MLLQRSLLLGNVRLKNRPLSLCSTRLRWMINLELVYLSLFIILELVHVLLELLALLLGCSLLVLGSLHSYLEVCDRLLQGFDFRSDL